MKPPLRRLWLCAASVVLALGLLTLALSMVQGAGSLTRVTTASDSNRDSYEPSLSADGTRIAFDSSSDFFGQGILPFQNEIWLYDTKTMTLTRITTAVGNQRLCAEAHLNADGTKISFNSDSDFLNQGIPDEQYEAWLYDTTAMTLTRITTASHGDRDSFAQSISADGTKIALYGDSDFLSQGIGRRQYEIWLYDTTTMTLTRVTTASGGGFGSRESLRPSLNADGTKVVFDSNSDFFNQGISNYQYEIWLYNTASMTLTRITTASANYRMSAGAHLDTAGTRITFSSDADFFSQGVPDDQYEVWLYNTASMTLTRVTTASHSNRDSFVHSISADGTKIAFVSDSDFPGQGIGDDHYDLWLYDTTTLSLTRVTTTTNTNLPFFSPSLNADGTKIAFSSDGDFLNQGAHIGQNEIWLYDNNPLPRFSLSTTHFPASATANRPLTYTLILTNNGSADATGVVVTDTLDSNVTFASASHGGLHNGGVVTWNVGMNPQGQVITRTLSVIVGDVPGGTQLINIAGVVSTEGASSSSTLTTTVDRQIYLPVLLK